MTELRQLLPCVVSGVVAAAVVVWALPASTQGSEGATGVADSVDGSAGAMDGESDGQVDAPADSEDVHDGRSTATPAWFAKAQESDRQDKETKKRWEANYQRNFSAVQAAFGREYVVGKTDGWYGRGEFAYVIPLQDGPSALYILTVGLSGWSGKDSWGVGIPMGFGGGYRAGNLMFYGGLSFGLGIDKGVEPVGLSPGGFAAAGFDFGRFRIMGEGRAEYRFGKAGASAGHLSYGALLSINPW